MPNPIALASEQFWETTRGIDTLLAKFGSSTQAVTPQLKSVASMDLDALTRVAETVWGADDTTNGTLAKSIETAQDTVNRAQTEAAETWRGDAWRAFHEHLGRVQTWLENAKPHPKAVGGALRNVATQLERDLLDIVTTVLGGASTVISGLSAVFGVLAALPEPVVSKIGAAIVALVLAIIAIVMFAVQYLKEERDKIEKIDAAIKSLRKLEKSI
jgi:hypothetical protein